MNENIAFILILTCSAAVADYMWYKIPNSIVIWGLGSSLILSGFTGMRLTSLLAGLVIPFILLFTVYLLKGVGAGDIKLLCVVGSAAGMELSIKFVVSSFLIAGMAGMIKLIYLFILKKKRGERFFFGNKIHYSYSVLGGVLLCVIME